MVAHIWSKDCVPTTVDHCCFDRGHAVAGMGHHSTSPVGQADELGASVAGIWLPLQVTELLEVVHEL